MRVEFYELEGKIYPLTFSLSTSNEIIRKYKNIHALQLMLESEKAPLNKKIEVLCNVLESMIYSGCQYYNAFKKQPYNKAPIDEEGIFVPLNVEQISVSLVPTEENINELVKKIKNCISISNKKEIIGKAKKNTKKKRHH